MRRHGHDRRRVIAVGNVEQAFDAVARLTRRADLGYHLVEMIPLDPSGNGNGTGSAAVLGRIETLAASQPIDEVFVALPLGGTQPLIRALVSLCEEQGITLRLVSSVADLILARAQLDEVDGRPVITLFSGPPDSHALLGKRLLDLGVSLVAGLLLLPLFVTLAIAINVDSPGPLLLAHDRVRLPPRA